MAWEVKYHEKAVKDLADLNNSAKVRVVKAVNKVSQNPLPRTEGGYGKPLGNRPSSKLAGLMKIKLKGLGLRVVYQLIRESTAMRMIVISIRDDSRVYKEAESRID